MTKRSKSLSHITKHEKFIILTVILFFIANGAFAQKFPETVLIKKNVLMKQTEVTIKEWVDFIANNNFDDSLFPNPICLSMGAKYLFEHLDRQSDFEFINIYGDRGKSSQIRVLNKVVALGKIETIENIDTNFISIYNPITGITFEQATRYCEWRQSIFNSVWDKKIKISLPPIKVYKNIITNIDSFCKQKCDSCELYQLNCKMPRCQNRQFDKAVNTQGKGPIRVDAHWPTTSGLYCLQGNVAEMTSTKGIAMGGSFRHFARESYSDQTQSYSNAADWLGFRYILTLR